VFITRGLDRGAIESSLMRFLRLTHPQQELQPS
jgi:hypothetical protein